MMNLEDHAMAFEAALPDEGTGKVKLWRELLEERRSKFNRSTYSNPPRSVNGMMVFMPGKNDLRCTPSRIIKPTTALIEQRKRIAALLTPRLDDATLAELYKTEHQTKFIHHPTPLPRTRRFMPSLAEKGEQSEDRHSFSQNFRASWDVKPSKVRAPEELQLPPLRSASVSPSRMLAAEHRAQSGSLTARTPLSRGSGAGLPAPHPHMDADTAMKVEKFRQIDTNGDQQLNMQEFMKACYIFGKQFSKGKMESMFKKMDKDNSGQVSFEEFIESPIIGWSSADQEALKAAAVKHPNERLAAQKMAHADSADMHVKVAVMKAKDKLLGHMKNNGQKLFHAFQKFDLDGGGTLSYAECVQALDSLGLNISKDTLMGVLQEFDEDRDGDVSYKEFVASLAGGQAGPVSWYQRHLDDQLVNVA